jgi:hypothetical protein
VLTTKQQESFQTTAAQSVQYFYNDLKPTEAAKWERQLKPHSGAAFIEPVSYAPFKDPAYVGRYGFIYCTKDTALTPAMQDQYIATHKVSESLVVRVEASHSPFLSKPEDAVSAIVKLTDAFSRCKAGARTRFRR